MICPPLVSHLTVCSLSLSPLSPKVLGCLAQLHHGSGGSSPSPTGNGFITKETFGAHVPSRAARRDGGSRDEDGGTTGALRTGRLTGVFLCAWQQKEAGPAADLVTNRKCLDRTPSCPSDLLTCSTQVSLQSGVIRVNASKSP